MISVTPVVLAHQKRRDGTYAVKMRFTHKRRMKYLDTNIILQPGDVAKPTEKNKSQLKIKNKAQERKATLLRIQIEDILGKLSVWDAGMMEVEDVVDFVRKALDPPEVFRLNFIEYGRKVASTKAEGSRNNYNSAINAFERYIGSDTVDISLVNVRMLQGFEAFLRNEDRIWKNTHTGEIVPSNRRKGDRAVALYLHALQHIHNTARKEFNEPDSGVVRIPLTPFDYYEMPKNPVPRHRNVDRSVIQEMIDREKDLSGRERLAVDVFLISFCFFGMNAVDLYSCLPDKDGVISYNRSKTKDRSADMAEMKVRIEDEIRPLVERYRDRTGKRMFSFHHVYTRRDTFNKALNAGLHSFSDIPFTFYSARHTWATLARSKDVNIDKSTVHEGLVHHDPSMRITDIYINKDYEPLWEANRKVLGLFDWSPLQ